MILLHRSHLHQSTVQLSSEHPFDGNRTLPDRPKACRGCHGVLCWCEQLAMPSHIPVLLPQPVTLIQQAMACIWYPPLHATTPLHDIFSLSSPMGAVSFCMAVARQQYGILILLAGGYRIYGFITASASCTWQLVATSEDTRQLLNSSCLMIRHWQCQCASVLPSWWYDRP